MVLRRNSKIPVLHHEGSSSELGGRIGETMGARLRAAADDVLAELDSASISLADLVAQLAPCIAAIESFAPALLDDLQARAEASGVPFPVLLYLNAGGMRSPSPGCTPADHCTSVISRSPVGCVVGHNEDATPAAIDDVFLLDARVPACTGPAAGRSVRLLGLCYAYTLVGCAATLNEHGLIVCVDTLSDPEIALGVPCDFVTRAVVEQATLDDALAVIRSTSRSGAASLTLAQGSRALSCEIASGTLEWSELTGDDAWVHTNHFVLAAEKYPAQLVREESLARWTRGQAIIRPRMQVAEVQALLADRADGPSAICRERTITSVVSDTFAHGLHLCFGEPYREGWTWYGLE